MARYFESARGTVHEWQRDHMGHINVRAYLDLFEQAAWQTYSQVGVTAARLRSGEVHMAAVQQNVTYCRELYPGDTVAVRTQILEARDKVLRFRHELYDTDAGDVCALCEFTVVCLDPDARKSRPFPPDVIERACSLVSPEEQ